MQPILLLTRPTLASDRFLAAINAEGNEAAAEISPLIDIQPIAAVRDGPAVSGVILTSENGATVAGRMGFPAGLVAYCVGDRTAEVAEQAGFRAVSAGGDADSLIGLILSRADSSPLIHLRGEQARGDIAARLGAAGVPCRDRIVYRQIERLLTASAKAALASLAPVVLPLFSPRTALILAAQGPFAAPIHLVAISAAVAAQISGLDPATVDISERPDGPAMVAATLSRLRALSASRSA